MPPSTEPGPRSVFWSTFLVLNVSIRRTPPRTLAGPGRRGGGALSPHGFEFESASAGEAAMAMIDGGRTVPRYRARARNVSGGRGTFRSSVSRGHFLVVVVSCIILRGGTYLCKGRCAAPFKKGEGKGLQGRDHKGSVRRSKGVRAKDDTGQGKGVPFDCKARTHGEEGVVVRRGADRHSQTPFAVNLRTCAWKCLL